MYVRSSAAMTEALPGHAPHQTMQQPETKRVSAIDYHGYTTLDLRYIFSTIVRQMLMLITIEFGNYE